jgi:hypothetical protein
LLPLGCVAAPLAFLALAGCNSWPHVRSDGRSAAPARVSATTPTAADLVAYLNENARRMQTLECRELLLDASHRLQTVGLTGQMACQKPRNFRMIAKAAGQPMVDMGSNTQEFWYWISKADPPYLFHCSHQDFSQGRARMPFPFQPDWVVEALGMGEYDPSHNYQVVAKPTTLELVETATSPQGQPVKKITVFNRAPTSVQVTAHKLLDAAGREICGAYIQETQQDRATGAMYPRRIQLVWPAEHIKLKMRLEEVSINGNIDQRRSASLFARPLLRDIQAYNLAQPPENNGVRRVAGPGR